MKTREETIPGLSVPKGFLEPIASLNNIVSMIITFVSKQHYFKYKFMTALFFCTCRLRRWPIQWCIASCFPLLQPLMVFLVVTCASTPTTITTLQQSCKFIWLELGLLLFLRTEGLTLHHERYLLIPIVTNHQIRHKRKQSSWSLQMAITDVCMFMHRTIL